MWGSLRSVRRRRTAPGQQAEARHARALLALVEQELQPKADAEYGPPSVDRAGDGPSSPWSRMRRIASPKLAHPRQHQRVGAADPAGVADDAHRRAQQLERLHGAAQIAHLVVEHDDRRRLTGCPSWSGMPPHARVRRDGHAERPGDGLDARLDRVVGVAGHEQPQVQRQAGVVREAAHELLEQLGLEAADDDVRQRHVDRRERAPREVDRRLGQALVHGHERRAVALDARPVAERAGSPGRA